MFPKFPAEESLEDKYKSTCVPYRKAGLGFTTVYGKIVKSEGKDVFKVLTTDNVKTGMTFHDRFNHSKFKVCRVYKKKETYPKGKSSDFVYLNVCDIKYEDKEKAKKK